MGFIWDDLRICDDRAANEILRVMRGLMVTGDEMLEMLASASKDEFEFFASSFTEAIDPKVYNSGDLQAIVVRKLLLKRRILYKPEPKQVLSFDQSEERSGRGPVSFISR